MTRNEVEKLREKAKKLMQKAREKEKKLHQRIGKKIYKEIYPKIDTIDCEELRQKIKTIITELEQKRIK